VKRFIPIAALTLFGNSAGCERAQPSKGSRLAATPQEALALDDEFRRRGDGEGLWAHYSKNARAVCELLVALARAGEFPYLYTKNKPRTAKEACTANLEIFKTMRRRTVQSIEPIGEGKVVISYGDEPSHRMTFAFEDGGWKVDSFIKAAVSFEPAFDQRDASTGPRRER
jgi:hypothetical protein